MANAEGILIFGKKIDHFLSICLYMMFYMMHMIACCESTTRVLPYSRFLSQVFKDVGIDLSKETNFEAPSTYDDQSMGQMKFEKTPNGFWIKKAERA